MKVKLRINYQGYGGDEGVGGAEEEEDAILPLRRLVDLRPPIPASAWWHNQI